MDEQATFEMPWRLIIPIGEGRHSSDAPPLVTYPARSWRAAEADEILAEDEHL